MSEKFTASNGVVVEVIDGDMSFNGRHSWAIPPKWIDAAREFFLHERDQELGRWRWPENPEWIVYKDRAYVIFNEVTSYVSLVSAHRCEEATKGKPYAAALNAYLAAHPVPKPWHDAKPGEVWLLTINGDESAFYPSKSLDRVFTPVAPNTGMTAVAMNGSTISSGRRIWPEAVES